MPRVVVPMPKADLAVYREPNGAARVSPGTLIASRRNKYVYVLNCTRDSVTVTIPVRLPARPAVQLRIRGRLGPRFGRNSKIKLDISRLPLGDYLYEVKVGADIAEGNSPPRMIIDE